MENKIWQNSTKLKKDSIMFIRSLKNINLGKIKLIHVPGKNNIGLDKELIN